MPPTIRRPASSSNAAPNLGGGGQLSSIASVAFASLPFDPTVDRFKIEGTAGVAIAQVQKPDGQVYTSHLQAGLQQFTHFDPTKISVAQRRELVSNMIDNGASQKQVAGLLGVSPATVSNDLRIIRDE